MSSKSIPYLSSSGDLGESTTSSASSSSNSFDVNEIAYGSYLSESRKVKDISDPNTIFKSTVRGNLTADYSTDKGISSDLSLDDIVSKMNTSIYLPNQSDTVDNSFIQTANYYNRFKIANPNMVLSKGFAHVFFVRPSCNILDDKLNILDSLNNNELFMYSYKNCKTLLKELVGNNGTNHHFMMSLSNAASSFSLSDEYINSDAYGKTYTGYKVAYGKNNIDSKTAGNFTVTYNDDRNLHIYQLHRLWVEYINGVYRGTISPKESNIINKILDYVGAVYYFVTAEDGETIIFWSKYYGVFPTTIPSSQYSWSQGNFISNPTLDIQYSFSFKEDYNPFTMVEFNYNSNVSACGTEYLPTYDSKLGHTGDTWVSAPFVELVKDETGNAPYYYKLRFRPK